MNELNVAQIKFILNQNNVGECRSIISIVNFECSYIVFLFQVSSKPGPTTAFTCSKSTIETLGKSWRSV